MKLINVVGARPNFMKIAPLMREAAKYPSINSILVHTGQHYEDDMSQVFFQDLGLSKPDIYLGVGSGTHAFQIGRTMIEFEKLCMKYIPDLVLVVGDVNATLACSIVAAKLCIPISHVEAGLRSFDRTMPEEINRIVTDSLSDYLFTSCRDANANLKKEGIPENKIFFVGNVMIDTLLAHLEKAKKSKILEKLGLRKEITPSDQQIPIDYAVLTLHRPSNVDNKETFLRIIEALEKISKNIPIIFPIHPRTRKQIDYFGLQKYFSFVNTSNMNYTTSIITDSVNCVNPLGYLELLNLVINSKFALTDSGGLQEETTVLGIPCLTLRENTERPITVTEGTNTVVGSDTEKIVSESFKILQGKGKKGGVPELWDGKAAERIVKTLVHSFESEE